MRDREPQNEPPPPPDWMRTGGGDACYPLRRAPEVADETNAIPRDVSSPPAGQDDLHDHAACEREPSRLSGWRSRVGRQLPLETETVVYIFISALDLFVTWMMLRSGNFHERNPLARYFLDHWGPKGMIYYKFSIVAIVTMSAQGIALKKLATARFILILGSIVSGAVVVYSIALFLRGAAG